MQPTRVIVVDGYQDVADTLAFLLNVRGFDARPAYTSAAALDLARSWNPAALILDIMLPVMNGHELAMAVRREVTPCPLFIAVTGYQHPGIAERSRALGFAGHFTKPVEPDAILRILQPARAA